MKSNIYTFFSFNTIPFILAFFICSTFSFALTAESSRGYLVTKDGVWLTGTISDIFEENQILFINDFGTPYHIHANLILGFVVNNKKGEKDLFVSKFSGTQWRFMKMVYQGERVNLYSAPVIRSRVTKFYANMPVSYTKDEYFIEMRNSYPVLITKNKFKGALKRLLKRLTPELAEKIGKRGYRYKDMVKILKEFNEIVNQKSYKM